MVTFNCEFIFTVMLFKEMFAKIPPYISPHIYSMLMSYHSDCMIVPQHIFMFDQGDNYCRH